MLLRYAVFETNRVEHSHERSERGSFCYLAVDAVDHHGRCMLCVRARSRKIEINVRGGGGSDGIVDGDDSTRGVESDRECGKGRWRERRRRCGTAYGTMAGRRGVVIIASAPGTGGGTPLRC